MASPLAPPLLVAEIPVGLEPVAAPGDGSHAAHFLHMLEGRAPTADVARVLDVILTLHADHELNASTFAARVAVATLADLHAAAVAAVATLKGPRQGGANDDVAVVRPAHVPDHGAVGSFRQRDPVVVAVEREVAAAEHLVLALVADGGDPLRWAPRRAGP